MSHQCAYSTHSFDVSKPETREKCRDAQRNPMHLSRYSGTRRFFDSVYWNFLFLLVNHPPWRILIMSILQKWSPEIAMCFAYSLPSFYDSSNRGTPALKGSDAASAAVNVYSIVSFAWARNYSHWLFYRTDGNGSQVCVCLTPHRGIYHSHATH